MSVIDFALELAGDVSSFTPSVRTEMKSAIAAQAGVDPSAVELTVTSGSVIVGVRILTPTVMATSVQSAMALATSNSSSATALLASVTGVPIAVLAVVTPPTATADVAPPPPPSPNAPFAISAGGGQINISSSPLVIASLAVSAALLCGLVICCTAMVCWWMKRRAVELRRKDVNDWPRNISVGTASADKLPNMGTASADKLPEQQPHACSRARVIASSTPPPLGRGGGDGGGGGIELSCRFDRHSTETEGSSRADGAEGGARPVMAGVIGASGSNTIRTEDVHASAHHGASSKDDATPPPYAPQSASSEGVLHAFQVWTSESIGGALHAFEVQGASRSIGGAAPVVMPHLGEDSIVLQEADIANFCVMCDIEAELDA